LSTAITNPLDRLEAVAVAPDELELAGRLAHEVDRVEILGLASIRYRGRTVRHRDREREAAIDRGQEIRFALDDDQRVAALGQRRIVQNIGIEKGALAPCPLPGFARRPRQLAVFLGNHGAAVEERKHDDVAVRIGNDLGFVADAQAPSGIDREPRGRLGGDPARLEGLDRALAQNVAHKTSLLANRSGGI
jgi:hypothetical protein